MPTAKWPKTLPPLSTEQQVRSDQFMQLWHEELARRSRYGLVERFNHTFPVRHSPANFRTTLEIGAGLGEHLDYEQLTPEQARGYYCNEYRENMAADIRRRHPQVQTIVGDCQQRMDFADGYFNRILAIHVLEHLPDLPACLYELHRLVNKETGRLLIVIPTEGSSAYSLARKLSAERVWYRHFTAPYFEFYGREHINLVPEILAELHPYFTIEHRTCFPLPFLPFVFCNLCLGYALKPRDRPLPG
ncbi:MAG: class I SAM-dependent methyltransferase [Lacunisphaera sp.]|nr:class I SAM-dependent methyltransferase [Lacunisphaera sp.]